MVTEGNRSCDLIGQQISERHHGAKIIGHALGALKGPDRGCENLPQILEGMGVWILDDLKSVVVHEVVKKRVCVGQKGEKKENEKDAGFAVAFRRDALFCPAKHIPDATGQVQRKPQGREARVPG
jgi:hypothetical protein